jgi:hypothetical protein
MKGWERGMSQGRKTPEEIRQKVRDLLFENENLYGKQLKEGVEKDPAFQKTNISLRTYQSIIKEELPKVRMVKASIPENIWTLGAFANTREVVPEAVPYIMEMQTWARDQRMSISERPYPPVSVRQAKWACCILPLYFTIFGPDKKLSDFGLGWLWRWSRAYSVDERLYELAGKKGVFDTSELDSALLRGDRIDSFGDTYVRFSGDANPDGKNKSVFVTTADKEILKKELKEGPMERSAHTISELPRFKKMIAESEQKKLPRCSLGP